MLRWLISLLALVGGFCFGLTAATRPPARSEAEIEAILGGVRLPPGFSISLFARAMFTRPGRDGTGGLSAPFAEGWSAGATPDLGRPVDVAEARDGALLVADDQNGAVYRIGYEAGQVAGK